MKAKNQICAFGLRNEVHPVVLEETCKLLVQLIDEFDSFMYVKYDNQTFDEKLEKDEDLYEFVDLLV